MESKGMISIIGIVLMPKKYKKITEKSIDDTIVVGDKNYDKVLIFIHGLGDNPSSWLFFANEIRKEISNIKIILPKAPTNSVSANDGLKMNSWFDIKKIPIEINEINSRNELKVDTSMNKGFDKSSDMILDESIKTIHNLIDYEISEKTIDPSNIFLGGFSQGAALSLISLLRLKNINLGGIILLSGWLLEEIILNPYVHLNLSNNIFIGHGNNDSIVKYENSNLMNSYINRLRTNQLLDDSNFSIVFNTYDNMGHSVSYKERRDIIDWMKRYKNR